MGHLDLFAGLPDHGAVFARTITTVYGDAGRTWLVNLPLIVLDYAQKWSFTPGAPFPLSYHYVMAVRCADGSEAVFKAGPPCAARRQEIIALQAFDGCGMARLLAHNLDEGVALIERICPGRVLAELSDEQATEAAAGVMEQLWQARAEGVFGEFPTIQHWGQGFTRLRARYRGGSGPFPAGLLAQAEGLFAELAASSSAPVLLHGDLHHFNILAAERRPWLAIDPQGVVGEPAYEVGALLRNPFVELPPPADLARLEARRVDHLAERLGLERRRLAGWGLAQAVLSAWWNVEDGMPGVANALAYAQALRTVRSKK